MPLKTKRWNEPRESTDGFRLLICRYRPRGVAKEAETWDAWNPDFGPSKSLHGSVYTESSSPIPWPQYRVRYLAEQKKNADKIAALATRIKAGETITLLCSFACTREGRCHRSLLKELIEAAAEESRPA
jgi:uncharacterized protein YeaO (DUF488 family)